MIALLMTWDDAGVPEPATEVDEARGAVFAEGVAIGGRPEELEETRTPGAGRRGKKWGSGEYTSGWFTKKRSRSFSTLVAQNLRGVYHSRVM